MVVGLNQLMLILIQLQENIKCGTMEWILQHGRST